MAEFYGIWKTEHVSIELRVQGECLALERVRGAKQKKKRVTMKIESLSSLAEAVLSAYISGPKEQISNQTPVGLVDGGYGFVILSWIPYFYGNCNALKISSGTNETIVVEQRDVLSFCLWLLSQAITVQILRNPV